MKWLRLSSIILALVVGGHLAMTIFVARTRVVNTRTDSPTVEARVVRFGSIASKWQADKVIVIASTSDGRTGQGVLASRLVQELDCRVGAPVGAHMVGSVLVVDALTCGKGWSPKR